MTALNKQALREAAEKATPGRWEYYPGNTSIEYNVDSTDEDQGSIVYVDSGDFTQKQTDLNGAFIASANPSTVLALLDELEAAEKRIAELQIARDKCFKSGLKTGWEYGIADDTEGYNREISDAQAVIDRAAGIQVIEGEQKNG